MWFCCCRKSPCFCKGIALWGQQRCFILIFLREELEEASLFMKGTDKHWNNGYFLYENVMWCGFATEINMLKSNVILKYHFFFFTLSVQSFFFQHVNKTHKTAGLKQAWGGMLQNCIWTLKANYNRVTQTLLVAAN